MSSSAGDCEIAWAASLPDITADSTQPALKPQSVQSPARVRLSYVRSSGEMRYALLPGSESVYRSLGLTFAVQNCVAKRALSAVTDGVVAARGSASTSHRNRPGAEVARGQRCP